MASSSHNRPLPTDLEKTRVLVLDCQTTGSNALTSHVIEIGWLTCRAIDPIDYLAHSINACLVQLPGDTQMPERITRLTGISDRILSQALSPARAYGQVLAVARKIAVDSGCSGCPTVIHFARFEKPFLLQLHRQWASDRPFEFHLICTHALAGRLLPGLPRKGLRAVAGYLGHSVPEDKRSAHHVLATAVVWHHLVKRLVRDEAIGTLSELDGWLTGDLPNRGSVRSYPMRPEKWHELPDRPGLYRMLRSNGDPLYVGKARSIRTRVASYFHKSRKHPEHILEMLSQARDIGHSVTATAMEAALLESDEIKRLNPPYNIALRPGHRRLCFLSEDYKRLAYSPDRTHCVGPLPANRDVHMLPLLVRALARDSAPMLLASDALSGYFKADPPDDCLLAQGLTVFGQRYQSRFTILPAAAAIRRIGRHLWHRHVILPQEPQDGEDGESGEQAQRTHVTPDEIAELLEQIVLRASHHIRRSRWLCYLSESLVTWQCSPDDAPDALRCLRLSGSSLKVLDHNLESAAPACQPPNWRLSRLDRQRRIDVNVYDRLRIVTTELRRLTVQNRVVFIWPRPGVRLPKACLERTLPWV